MHRIPLHSEPAPAKNQKQQLFKNAFLTLFYSTIYQSTSKPAFYEKKYFHFSMLTAEYRRIMINFVAKF